MTWHQITPSGFPWERAALDHVQALLPERHPYQAWSNFTFVSDRGHVREVDLLVAAPSGLHLVEIKNFKGRLSNRGATWVLDDGRRRPPFDSPLPLADQKAKELKSLLGGRRSRRASAGAVRAPDANGDEQPTPHTVATLTDQLRAGPDVVSVAELWAQDALQRTDVEVRLRRLRTYRVLAPPRQARRAQGTVHLVPGRLA